MFSRRLAALITLGFAGCLLPTFERGEPISNATSAGGTSSTSSSSAGGGQGGEACVLATPVEPPANDDAGTSQEATAAVRIFSVVDDNGTLSGFDQDGLCSCKGDSWSCLPNKLSRQSEAYCDAPGGRDNAFGQLLVDVGKGLDQSFSSWKTRWSAAADEGRWGLLFELSDYNGSLNDQQLAVRAFTSDGFELNSPKPIWQGADSWPISSDSFTLDGNGQVDPTAPLSQDEKAYVRDGFLVARLPVVRLRVDTPELAFELLMKAVILQAKLEGSGTDFTMRDGKLAGRIEAIEMIRALNSIQADDLILCQQEDLYKPTRSKWCVAMDLHADGKGTATDPCDGISVSFRFEAFAAVRGEVVPPADFDRNCPPEAASLDPVCVN